MLLAGTLTAGLVLVAAASVRTFDVSPVAGVTGAASGPHTGHTPKGQNGHTPEAEDSPEPAETPEPSDGDSGAPQAGGGNTTHPCNHGFYVSQAAHTHKGGPFVSSVARTDLGKNGNCSAPLPQP